MIALMELGVRFAWARLDSLGFLFSWDRFWACRSGLGISGSMVLGSWVVVEDSGFWCVGRMDELSCHRAPLAHVLCNLSDTEHKRLVGMRLEEAGNHQQNSTVVRMSHPDPS